MSKILKTKQDVFNYLKTMHIEYKEYTHDPALSIADLQKSPGSLENGPFLKNLVYVDKKNNLYFVVAHEATKVGGQFWKALGTTKNNVRFAKEDALEETLGTYKGAVNIFALANDESKKVPKVIFDAVLEKNDYLSFHPQDNSSTVEVKHANILEFLDSIGRSYVYLKLEDSEETPVEEKKVDEKVEDKGETKLKIDCKKSEDFSSWYSQVIIKAELIDYYDISGCYILKPNSYYLWERIQQHMDEKFKSLGVRNCYFPMFVSSKNLNKEKEHVEGFEPEVAWVTHSGKSKLAEPIAIRPTSETIMYPTFSKWVKSYRDLPVLVNQWTNVVRWEFKHPTPFIRTREFLWQEGHTAHASYQEATDFVYKILDIYEDTYTNLLAVPVIKGVKSDNEKFAGADFTTTCETFIAENGRAIQACTSHQLGENFAKMFDIQYLDQKMETKNVVQTSWGFTTRSIGILVMIHGDDKGLVLPPKVALTQVVVMPIYFKNKDNDKLNERCRDIVKVLRDSGIRVELDDRENYTAGWKFNDWELKGTPLRVEMGPKDLESDEVKLVRRVDNVKKQASLNNILETVQQELDDIHKTMLENASQKLYTNIEKALDWSEFMTHLNNMKVVKTPWCNIRECEEEVKEKSAIESKNLPKSEISLSGSAKTLCKPLQQDPLEGHKCFHCAQEAKTWILWGRSY